MEQISSRWSKKVRIKLKWEFLKTRPEFLVPPDYWELCGNISERFTNKSAIAMFHYLLVIQTIPLRYFESLLLLRIYQNISKARNGFFLSELCLKPIRVLP